MANHAEPVTMASGFVEDAEALKAGLTFRPLPTTAADTLAWFQKQPADRQAKLRSGLTPDRETALLTEWKASAKA